MALVNMFTLLLKVPLFWYARYFNSGIIKPISYTYSITSQCNSRCKTCNIWGAKKDEFKNELSLEEWEKTIKSIGSSPFWITLSGGEPFISKDIVGIVDYICRYNKPSLINIPTNSILKEKIIKKTKEILEITKHSKTGVVINLSLDGIDADHDEIRGVNGNFESVKYVYEELHKLKKKYNHLTIGIHTVISKFNQDKIIKIAKFVEDNFKPDNYITEIAENRIELKNENWDIAPDKHTFFEQTYELMQQMQKKRSKFPNLKRVIVSFRLKYYAYVMRYLLKQDTKVSCYAGLGSCHINYNGEIWPCCIKCHNMGNLREYNYNFDKVFNSPAARKIRKDIKTSNCKCTLANVNYTNMIFNMKVKENISYER